MKLTKESKLYGFRQLETGLTAFVQNIESRFHAYIEDLPVFVLWTGDNNIYMNTKLVQCKDQEVYEQIPRVVIKFNTFSDEQSEHTNQYNRYIFKGKDENELEILGECSMRRLPLYFDVQTTFVSSNFIDALQHAEMILSLINRENAFSYEYQGSVFNGAFASDSSQEFTFPEIDTGTRNFTQAIPFKVQIPLYSPKIETIKPYADIEGVKIEIGVHDVEDKYTSSRELIQKELRENPELKEKVDKTLKRKHKPITEENEIAELTINDEALSSQKDFINNDTIES